MKANQRTMRDEEDAVSPVIAVILMVAITVVLAATVFILVGSLGQDVGDTGPTLGMTTTDADSGKWALRVTSITNPTALDQFNCILTTPTDVESASCESFAGTYTLSHEATGAADKLSVGDRLTLSGAFGDSEEYELELVHRPTGTSAGTISRTF